MKDAGPANRDAGPAVGENAVGSRLPPGAQIAVRVDMTRIRASPIADDIRAFLGAIPDWQALLDGSGISPVDQLDRLLIATPDLKRSKVVLAGRFIGDARIVEEAVAKLAAASGKKAPWHPEGGVQVARWLNADDTPRVIALVGPQHFTISRIEDLPRVLAIAAARVADRKPDAGPVEIPADALLSMGENEGLSLEVDGVERFIKRAPRGVPSKLRVAAIEVPGPAISVRAQLVFADGEKAADALRFWDAVRKSYARNALIALMGLSGPLKDAVLELKDQELAIRTELSVEQTRLILGYVRELFTPPAPCRAIPRKSLFLPRPERPSRLLRVRSHDGLNEKRRGTSPRRIRQTLPFGCVQIMSFSFLSAVARTLRDAGFAGNICSWPVKGFMRLPAFLAGTARILSLRRSGTTNSPGPFLPNSRLIRSLIAANTPETSFLDTPVFSDSAPMICDLLIFFPPAAAAAAGAAFLLAICLPPREATIGLLSWSSETRP